MNQQEASPLVVVAMATFNGLPWIRRQVKSILAQRGVEVSLVISDDGSTDGTRQWAESLAREDNRVTLLPPREGPAGVGPNFLHLVEEISPPAGAYVAFSDQDDLWHPKKLRHQVDFLTGRGADATSSNVLAFNSAGERHVIYKNQPQKKWDFIFEAPGPGSTFLLTGEAFKTVREHVCELDTETVWLHDWLIYALVRAAGGRWVIDPRPHVAYRQHEGNILGAHRGWEATKTRWKNLRSGKYQKQFQLIARAARQAGAKAGRDEGWLADLDRLIGQLEIPVNHVRPGLLPQIFHMRRRPLEAVQLGMLGVLGLW